MLDTNTLIYFFKGQGRIAENLLDCTPGDIGIPAIVIYELQVGIAKSSFPDKRRQQLGILVTLIQVLPFQYREAEASAGIRATLERQGLPIGPYDILIAGTALAHGATLVTRNTREFERIDQLRLEDWYA